jgi:hypothetical protein
MDGLEWVVVKASQGVYPKGYRHSGRSNSYLYISGCLSKGLANNSGYRLARRS